MIDTNTITVNINLDDVTMGDLFAAEKLVGRPLVGSFTPDRLTADAMMALVTVYQRKVDPEFTMEDAANLRVAQLNATREAGESDADPTGATGTPS